MFDNIVYTCVIGNYDRLYPPLGSDPNTRYIALTDDPKLKAPGWEVQVLKARGDLTPSTLNRHCKLFPWKYLPEAKKSIYVDGNIRILSQLSRLFDLIDEGYDIALLRHPHRNFVHEEINACIKLRKINNPDTLYAEQKVMFEQGFIDQGQLTENGVIIRSHLKEEVRVAMELWWSFVQSYSGRDQVSLHHCLTNSDVKSIRLPFNVREPNPYFDIYPHFGQLKTWDQRVNAHNAARRSENYLMEFRYHAVRKIIRILLRLN
jgi:hypothetical protein